MTDLRAPGAAALLGALPPGHRIAFAVIDDDLRTVVVSPSLPAMSGLPPGSYEGRRAADLMPEGTGAEIAAALADLRDTDQTYIELPRLASEDPAAPTFRAGCYRLGPRRGAPLGVVLAETTERTRTEGRLRASRERLAAAERLAGLGAWTWLPDEDRWTWSEELFRLAGLEPAPEPPPFAEWVRTLAPESQRPALEIARRARAGEPFDLIVGQLRPDGSRRILRGWAQPSMSGGRLVRIDGVVQDVTELQRVAGRQQAVAELGHAALGGATVDDLLDQAAAVVASTLDLEHVTVIELQEGDDRVLRTRHGWPEPGADGLTEVPPDSQVAHALRTGEPIVVEDWSSERRFVRSPLLQANGIRSGASVPIRGRDGLYGALSAHSREPYAVSAEDLAFLGAVANVLGNAVERLRLEAELSEQAAARGRLVAQTLDAEDGARREISETLHDGPLQDVLALHQQVARLPPGGEREAAHLERARASLARAIEGLRDVMLELHPVVLDVGGLESALGAVAAQQAQLGGFEPVVRVEPDAHGARDDLILSLARELLINAAKHARATRVGVTVRRDGDRVVLEVADDGRGMEPDRPGAALAEGHVGLASIRQRVETAGGSVAVDGEPGGGTRVTIAVPATS